MNLQNFKKIFLYFIFYSIIGWVYEIFLEVIVYKWGYMPREFFRGPIAPIYGIGAILIIFCFYNYSKKTEISFIKRLILVFVGSIILTTIIELIASYIFEIKTGTWAWRTGYLKYVVNFEGRVALSTSIRFGLICVLCVFVIHRLFDKFLDYLIVKKIFNKFFYLVLILFIFDFIFAIVIPTNIKLDVYRG